MANNKNATFLLYSYPFFLLHFLLHFAINYYIMVVCLC